MERLIKNTGRQAPCCPLCQSFLINGNSITSKVFGRGDRSKSDHLCYIFGCRECYPNKKRNLRRTCPVCHADILDDGYLLGRLFDATEKRADIPAKKPHVIINGCPHCARR